MTPLVFLDTETDGVHPGRKVYEVAMIRRDENGERETSFFVDIDLSTADPFGLKVGRFYDRHPFGRYLSGLDDRVDYRNGIRHSYEAAREVARFTHGAHIVGMVPNFDTEVLANLLRAEGLTPAWHYHLIDVENLALGWLHGVAARAIDESREWGESPDPALVERGMSLPWNSDEISRACGVEPPGDDERHTALGDAKWCARLWDRITGPIVDGGE